jgi:hypothetical protein
MFLSELVSLLYVNLRTATGIELIVFSYHD